MSFPGWLQTVYPRWRGEHDSCCQFSNKSCGLSPLARGTHPAAVTTSSNSRFIPAGAGNTCGGLCGLAGVSVYPRWRGEHVQMTRARKEKRGLSPLARGTQRRLRQCAARLRFIPAGAGNTLVVDGDGSGESVYPRWRGEHPAHTYPPQPQFGLSPLARGTPTAQHFGGLPSRFIPAGAGNTLTSRQSWTSTTVYPRWRGEHLAPVAPQLVTVGLSPLARGTHHLDGTQPQAGRFIPAGAGNTVSCSPPRWASTVYPRWRGEHAKRIASLPKDIGLSPLARGTH